MAHQLVVVSALAALACVSCATPSSVAWEPAHAWTEADSAQLQSIIGSRGDIGRVVRDVKLLRPDLARVITTSRAGVGERKATEFTIEKKQGRWRIVGPILHTQMFIIS
jgi:hypothetical protein